MEVTHQKIAEKAGLSRSTVSRALRNHPAIPEATRIRVKTAARELNYRADPMISALMSRVRHGLPPGVPPVIGYVSAASARDWRTKPSLRQIHSGATERAEQLGYRLEEFMLSDKSEAGPSLNRVLAARNVQGLLVAPAGEPAYDLRLDWKRFASVAIGYELQQEGIHRVRANHFQGMTLALEQLRQRGYRRIGAVLPSRLDNRLRNRWAAAFLLDRQQHGDPDPDALLLTKDETVQQSFWEWLEKWRPEAVIGPYGSVFDWIQRTGKRVPEDLAFVTLGHLPGQTHLAGVNQRLDLLGALAVNVVTEQLHQNARGLDPAARTILLDSHWVPGPSVGRSQLKG